MHQFYGERDYRGAVVEAAVLFECWLKAYLRERYRAAGLSSDRIEKKFRSEKGRIHSADYVAKSLIKDAVGLDFGNTVEYANWRKLVAEVRNDLVHGTRHVVSSSDAVGCVEALYAARRRIISSK